MTPEELKKKLMDGAVFVFAKQLNAVHNVRACYALVFDRRRGFHVVEKSLKQLRVSMEAEGGIILGIIRENNINMIPPYNGEVITEMPQELEEETYQKLPSHEFTVIVLERKLMKKIGFF